MVTWGNRKGSLHNSNPAVLGAEGYMGATTPEKKQPRRRRTMTTHYIYLGATFSLVHLFLFLDGGLLVGAQATDLDPRTRRQSYWLFSTMPPSRGGMILRSTICWRRSYAKTQCKGRPQLGGNLRWHQSRFQFLNAGKIPPCRPLHKRMRKF